MNKIFEKIKSNSTIIIGVSGGPDSIYLLYQCLALASKPRIIVAHLNHQLRGNNSDRDAVFTRKLCQKLQLQYEEKTVNLQKQKGNLEENCRKVRYEYFEKLRKKYQAEWILTGHHLNDQVETILFNLSRGIHTQGIKGIATISIEKKILRPLLTIEKKDILTYLKKNKIAFRKDESNENLKFSRNLIRHKIIPLFQKLNPNFLNTFIHSIENLQKSTHFSRNYAKTWLEENLNKNGNCFDLDQFLKHPLIIQENLLTILFKKINQKTVTTQQLQEILKTLQAQKSGRFKEFGKKHIITIIKNEQTRKREVVIQSRIK